MKKVSLLLFLMCILLAFSACSNSKNNDLEDLTKKINNQAYDNTFVVPVSIDVKSLAPSVDSSAVTKQILRNMNEGIFKYDKDSKIILGLASNIEKSEDGKIWTVTLKDAKFHNGKELTSDDFIYSIKRVAGLVYEQEKVLENAFLFLLDEEKGGSIENLEKIDDKTVKIHFNDAFLQKNASNVENLFADVFLVPSNVSEKEQKESPIGIGPYKFKRRVIGESIELEIFDDYYGEKPDIKDVQFKIFSDNNSKLLAFEGNEIDYIELTKNNEKVVQNMKGVTILEKPSQDVRQIFLNHKVKPFNDIRVRKAINYAIDKNELIKVVNNGVGDILETGLSKYNKFYNDKLENTYNFDLEKAKELLEQAGYEKGFDTKLAVVSENTLSVDIAVIIKEQLKKVGINVELEPLTWNDFYDRVYKKRMFEMADLQIFSYPDAYRMLKRYKIGQKGNLAGFENEEFDKLIDLAGSETNENKSKEYIQKAQQLLVDDAMSIFLFDQGMRVALSPKYYDLNIYPIAYIDISSIKVKE